MAIAAGHDNGDYIVGMTMLLLVGLARTSKYLNLDVRIGFGPVMAIRIQTDIPSLGWLSQDYRLSKAGFDIGFVVPFTQFGRIVSVVIENCADGIIKLFIRFGSDTPKLASAL